MTRRPWGAHARARAFVAMAVSALLVAAVVAPTSTGGAEASAAVAASPRLVQGADVSQFRPGNIVSDSVFFDSGSMTEAEIQTFLERRVPSCESGYVCLKDWYDTSRATSADAMCGAYSGGMRERASRIIFKVAQACGVNPKVILVFLQKEQGLVTHTWPSDFRYRAAMGQGCPDTAACDTRYYGFFNQVFYGVWQLKRYGNPPGTSNYFNWYAPGKTWNVLYHPPFKENGVWVDRCGSSPVFIENQATANLYYYTPYQPNAAAIRAGYGEGDGCSSYGNRNFYQYFTDWFGSTQAGRTLVNVGPDIFVLSGGVRYHITYPDWPAYNAALGNPSAVTTSYLQSFTDGGVASRFVLNTSNGALSLLDGGKLHQFDNCAQVAQWGGSCATPTRLTGGDFGRIGNGPPITGFARTETNGRIHQISPNSLIPLYDNEASAAYNGGTVPYAAVMPGDRASRYARSPLRFAPATFVQAAGDPRVWLPTIDGRLLYLSNWRVAAELGFRTSATVINADLVSNFTRHESLSSFVTCGTQNLYAASGTFYPISDATGFAPLALDATMCGQLKISGSAAPLFVKSSTSSAVYHVTAGVIRHVATMAQLTAIAGGAAPRIVSVSPAALAAFKVGAPHYVTGELVKSPTSQRVYLADEGALLYVSNFSIIRDLGLSVAVRTVTDLVQPTTERNVGTTVGCGGTTYVAASGVLSPGGDPAIRSDLSSQLCALLNLAS